MSSGTLTPFDSEASRDWDALLGDWTRADHERFVEVMREQHPSFWLLSNADMVPVRPPILSGQLYAAAASATHRLARLVARAFFAEFKLQWPKAVLDAGFDPSVLDLFDPVPDDRGATISTGRGDFCISQGQMKFFEVNIHTALGALYELAVLPRFYLGRKDGAAMRKRHALYADSAVLRMAELLEEVAGKAQSVIRPRVAVVDLGLERLRVEQFATALAAAGLPTVFARPADLAVRNGRVLSHDLEVDLVLRMFPIYHLEFPRDTTLVERLADVHRHGAATSLPDEAISFASTKVSLALLWERIRELAPADAEFVRTTVPWTARIENETADVVLRDGAVVDTAQLLATARERDLVLKKGASYGGAHVVVARGVTPGQWDDAAQHALREADWVVQEFVEAEPSYLPFFTDAGKLVRRKVDVVLGVCNIGGRPAGCLVRYRRPGATGPINVGTGAGAAAAVVAG